MLDTATGIAYGSRYVSTTMVGDTEWGDMGNQVAYQTRASMSYVTGSHNFKVGCRLDDRRQRDREHLAALCRISTS